VSSTFRPSRPCQVVRLILQPIRQDEVNVLESIQQRKPVGSDGGVCVLAVKARGAREQIVKRADEFRPVVGRRDVSHGRVGRGLPISVCIFPRAVLNGQSVRIIVNVPP